MHLKLHQMHIAVLEGTARYAGVHLVPAEGFKLWPRFNFGSFGLKTLRFLLGE